MKHVLPSVLVLVVLTLLTGGVYPLLVTGVAKLAFRDQADGSLLRKEGTIVGSSLIGQEFDDPGYFWGRPSATAPAYSGGASSGSNLGPLNPALHEGVTKRIAALRAADPGNAAPIPVDLCTASGSGLDPHVSPASAFWQASRVARTRGLAEDRVRALIERHVETRTFGVFGEPRVNVLALNLALDAGP